MTTPKSPKSINNSDISKAHRAMVGGDNDTYDNMKTGIVNQTLVAITDINKIIKTFLDNSDNKAVLIKQKESLIKQNESLINEYNGIKHEINKFSDIISLGGEGPGAEIEKGNKLVEKEEELINKTKEIEKNEKEEELINKTKEIEKNEKEIEKKEEEIEKKKEEIKKTDLNSKLKKFLSEFSKIDTNNDNATSNYIRKLEKLEKDLTKNMTFDASYGEFKQNGSSQLKAYVDDNKKIEQITIEARQFVNDAFKTLQGHVFGDIENKDEITSLIYRFFPQDLKTLLALLEYDTNTIAKTTITSILSNKDESKYIPDTQENIKTLSTWITVEKLASLDIKIVWMSTYAHNTPHTKTFYAVALYNYMKTSKEIGYFTNMVDGRGQKLIDQMLFGPDIIESTEPNATMFINYVNLFRFGKQYETTVISGGSGINGIFKISDGEILGVKIGNDTATSILKSTNIKEFMDKSFGENGDLLDTSDNVIKRWTHDAAVRYILSISRVVNSSTINVTDKADELLKAFYRMFIKELIKVSEIPNNDTQMNTYIENIFENNEIFKFTDLESKAEPLVKAAQATQAKELEAQEKDAKTAQAQAKAIDISDIDVEVYEINEIFKKSAGDCEKLLHQIKVLKMVESMLHDKMSNNEGFKKMTPMDTISESKEESDSDEDVTQGGGKWSLFNYITEKKRHLEVIHLLIASTEWLHYVFKNADINRNNDHHDKIAVEIPCIDVRELGENSKLFGRINYKYIKNYTLKTDYIGQTDIIRATKLHTKMTTFNDNRKYYIKALKQVYNNTNPVGQLGKWDDYIKSKVKIDGKKEERSYELQIESNLMNIIFSGNEMATNFKEKNQGEWDKLIMLSKWDVLKNKDDYNNYDREYVSVDDSDGMFNVIGNVEKRTNDLPLNLFFKEDINKDNKLKFSKGVYDRLTVYNHEIENNIKNTDNVEYVNGEKMDGVFYDDNLLENLKHEQQIIIFMNIFPPGDRTDLEVEKKKMEEFVSFRMKYAIYRKKLILKIDDGTLFDQNSIERVLKCVKPTGKSGDKTGEQSVKDIHREKRDIIFKREMYDSMNNNIETEKIRDIIFNNKDKMKDGFGYNNAASGEGGDEIYKSQTGYIVDPSSNVFWVADYIRSTKHRCVFNDSNC